MKAFVTELTTGITRTPEFERKRLASFAVNVGTKCGHDCAYCSTGAQLRMHRSFREAGQSPFSRGYALVDPTIPQRVARDANRIRNRGLVQLCTVTDAWSPEAQTHQLGRRCLEAVLSQPGWTVRVLTKNAAVGDDFDLIEKYRDRVLVGLSMTATPRRSSVVQHIETYASSLEQRLAMLREASKRGLRTYGMLCPLLPGIADGAEEIDELVRLMVECRVEEIFVEPVNSRGPGLRLTEDALRAAGFAEEATAVGRIRRHAEWSGYVRQLIANVQASVRRHFQIDKLRVLLYPSNLSVKDVDAIRHDDAGVIWLTPK